MQDATIPSFAPPVASGTDRRTLRVALAAWCIVATAAFGSYCSLVLHHDGFAHDLLAGLVLPAGR